MSNNSELVRLFRDTACFDFVLSIDNFVFLAGPIGDLTAFCSPSKRAAIGGHARLNFEYGLTVVPSISEDRGHELELNLRSGNYVALPKTIPSKHSFDMLLTDNGVSDWLISEMSGLMTKYCLPAVNAIELINGSEDKLIENLRVVYGGDFDRIILEPLLIMSGA